MLDEPQRTYNGRLSSSNTSDFQREDFTELEESTELEFLPEFDGLTEAVANIGQISEIDRRVGTNLISHLEKEK